MKKFRKSLIPEAKSWLANGVAIEIALNSPLVPLVYYFVSVSRLSMNTMVDGVVLDHKTIQIKSDKQFNQIVGFWVLKSEILRLSEPIHQTC